MVPYQDIFRELQKHNVRYLVAGGVALNLHQVARTTVDLDLILHLERDNVLVFAEVMKDLGFRPKVPVDAADFADEKKREQWIAEKNMLVFSFINLKNPLELVDIFVREPMPFAELYQRRVDCEVFGITIPIIGIKDLITLKEVAGRTKDLYDIKMLKDRLDE